MRMGNYEMFFISIAKKEFDLRTFNSFEWTEHWIEVEWQYAFIVTVVRVEYAMRLPFSVF